ncbi:MAG: hypothetical protein H7Y42_18530 [Chitinophagaceae bacterium]|nr:hypothetical protein [Chitinophagaceae bacterium]
MGSTLNLKAPWEKVKELLKENDHTLTDDDLRYTPGQEDELLGRLQEKMKKDKQAVKEYIESISSNSAKAS